MRTLDLRTGLLAAVLLPGLAGCHEPPKPIVTYPEGTLPVHYEPATAHSTCLVASLAMAANYLLGERRLTEAAIRQDMKSAGKDETSIEDLKAYLDSKRLYMLSLSGRLNAKPPVDLGYWVRARGYPVICVVNQQGDDPAFNHAVVVTGIVKAAERQALAAEAAEGQASDRQMVSDPAAKVPTESGATADTIYYLDPSAPRPMQSATAEEFEVIWARGGHAMMIVVAPPTDTGPAK